MSKKLFLRLNFLVLIATVIPLLLINKAAEAVSITFDTNLSTGEPDLLNLQFDSDVEVGEVHSNVSSSDAINGGDEVFTENGGTSKFNNFFDSNFLLLGAKPTDLDIFSDSHKVGVSTALSNQVSLSSADIQKNLFLEFDWSFQGNASESLTALNTVTLGSELFDLDTFKISMVKVSNGVSVDLFERLDASYGSNRSERLNINNLLADSGLTDFLEVGDYTINVTLVETVNDVSVPTTLVSSPVTLSVNSEEIVGPIPETDVVTASAPVITQAVTGGDTSSAAGIGNMTLSAEVPFEFSPSQGIFLVAGFWGLSFYIKRRKKEIANQQLANENN